MRFYMWLLVIGFQYATQKMLLMITPEGEDCVKVTATLRYGGTPTVLDHPKKGMGSIIGTALEAAEKELDPLMFHCPCLLPNKS